MISHALSHLPLLINSVEDISSPRCRKDELMAVAKQSNAALAALGGFEPTIKPGCKVQITGKVPSLTSFEIKNTSPRLDIVHKSTKAFEHKSLFLNTYKGKCIV